MPALPDYENPPVEEVAIGVQFAPLKDFLVVHMGAYWDTVRDTFSEVEQQPPIAHVIERDELGTAAGTGPQILKQLELPRAWFSDAAGAHLIQLQRDRFLYNWRKQHPEDEYPRFPPIKAAFLERWRGFLEFLNERGLAAPNIDQCELTYVNMIRRGVGWDTMRDIEKLFTCLQWLPREGFLLEPETVSWKMCFKLPEKKGRLHVTADPVFTTPDNTLAVRFALTVRGMPPGEYNSIDDRTLGAWFDVAREWIVRGFVDLVEKGTDVLWGRRA